MSLFRSSRQWAPEPIVPAFPGAPGSESYGTPSMDRAMQVSAVWACVRLLADSVSMMPLAGYTLRNGVRVPSATTPTLFSNPSVDANPSEWVYMTMVSLLLRGNAYGHIVGRDSRRFPTQVELLDPDRMSCRDQGGRAVYSYNGNTIPADDVMHVRAFRMPGRRHGLSPIRYAATQINTDAAASAFGLDFLQSGGHPSALLSTEKPLSQDQAKTMKERFLAAVKGREPAVLSGGVKYETVQISPEESQFLETQKYGVSEIARIFGVPPEMIASEAGNSMTYANVEQRSLDFLTYSVQPWLTRLESSYARLLPGNQHVRFDTSVLTRADLLTQMQATAVGIASKQTTPDEARAMRDMPPLTDDQKTVLDLVPMAITAQGKPRLTPAPAPEGEPA